MPLNPLPPRPKKPLPVEGRPVDDRLVGRVELVGRLVLDELELVGRPPNPPLSRILRIISIRRCMSAGLKPPVGGRKPLELLERLLVVVGRLLLERELLV
jgi:hypothetical protein